MNQTCSEKLKLTPRQVKLVALVVSGKSQRVAARETGISERTASVWLAEDHVKAAVREGMNRIRQEAEMQLSGALGHAVKALLDVLKAEDISPVVRVNAARAVLDYGLRYREQGELSDRITEIERQVDGQH